MKPNSSLALVVAALAIAASSLVGVARGDASSEAEALVQRRFPALVGFFDFSPLSTSAVVDTYTIENAAGHRGVHIRGNSAVAMAAGLGYYMRYVARTQLSWDGDQLIAATSPSTMPLLTSPITGRASSKWGYAWNTCTHSYSGAFWTWERWERELDWMALNGLNMPLAFTGQEAVWLELYRELGLTDSEILADWVSGPAFLAWFRMGNIQAWAGPMPLAWVEAQRQLQVKILARARALGMTPVLPMFSGYVPTALKKHYPTAQITLMYNWARFNDTYRTWALEVTDPLFKQIGKRFLEIQDKMYGNQNHIFNADTYNEMVPPSTDLNYLKSSSRGVYEAMIAADPNGIWLMQGWLFYNERSWWTNDRVKAYLSGVPDDRMIILDLYTEAYPVWSKTEHYYGKPWVWCMLHNFGGTPGMYGNLTQILSQPHIDRLASKGMVGIGITMEAIEQNFVMYEAMAEARWRSSMPNVADWVDEYVLRRYGTAAKEVDAVIAAWQLLAKTTYASTSRNTSAIELRPALPTSVDDFPSIQATRSKTVHLPRNSVAGNFNDLWHAWSLFLSPEVVQKLGYVQTYTHDFVMVGREVLINLFKFSRADLNAAYARGDAAGVEAAGKRMLDIILDIDRLLKTDRNQLLGKWISAARNQGTNQAEADLLEFNARNQITLWGPEGEILDYARKPWSGLYTAFYHPRWALFVQRITEATRAGTKFDQNKFNAECLLLEKAWQTAKDTFPTVPYGVSAAVATELMVKYRM